MAISVICAIVAVAETIRMENRMSRSWTWIDEDAERSEEETGRLTPILNELAAQWSRITAAEEQRGWARQAAIEDGDYDEPDFDSDEEAEDFRRQQSKRGELQQLRLEGIEAQLEHFGARIMRPYEHWNEDERYMQYMECDRFGDSY
jgi:hypothetical protein